MIPNPQLIVKRCQTRVTRVDPAVGVWTQILPGEIRRWNLEFVPDLTGTFCLWIGELPDTDTGYRLMGPTPLELKFADRLDWLSNPWFIFSRAGPSGLFIVETIILGSDCQPPPKTEIPNVS